MDTGRPSTAPGRATAELTPLQPAYAANRSSAERALSIPPREMSVFEARQRHNARRPGLSIGEPENLAGPNQGQPSNSTDNENVNQEEDPQPKWWSLAACIRFFRKLTPHPFSRSSGHAAVAPKALNDKEFYADVEYKKVENYPNRSIVQLAALLDSNDSFCMFRRFGTETVRLLKFRAIELDQLARQIDETDKTYEKDAAYRLDSIEYREGWDTALTIQLEEYDEKIRKYYDLLLKYVEVRSLSKPSSRDYQSVFNWIKEHEPICNEECRTMLRKDDFVSTNKNLQNNRGTRIEDMVESFASKHPKSRFLDRLRGDDEKRRTGDPLVHHLSSSRLAILARIIVALLAVGTMLIPVFVIFLVQPSREVMVSIVAVFVTIVMVSIALVVEVSAQDVFLSMAAYSAVLVALLSNMMNQAGGACSCPK